VTCWRLNSKVDCTPVQEKREINKIGVLAIKITSRLYSCTSKQVKVIKLGVGELSF